MIYENPIILKKLVRSDSKEKFYYKNIIKAMDQPDHVTSIIAITVCKVLQKLITKIDFWYQTNLGSFSHISSTENSF